MERCVAKIETKDAEKKLARLRKIASEAMKQCGRTEEMAIDEPRFPWRKPQNGFPIMNSA